MVDARAHEEVRIRLQQIDLFASPKSRCGRLRAVDMVKHRNRAFEPLAVLHAHPSQASNFPDHMAHVLQRLGFSWNLNQIDPVVHASDQ